jgi:hypothetical protein
VGRYAFSLQPAFHKVFVLPGGLYLEFDTGADLHYNPTGLIRVHRLGVPPETLSDGVSSAAAYRLPSKPTRSLALGPEWRDRSGAWHALADHGRDDLEPTEFVLLPSAPTQLEVRLTYRGRLRGGASAVVEQLLFKDGRAEIDHRVEGDVDAVRQCWPMLATDGMTPSGITVSGRSATVTRGGGGFTFEALTDGAVVSRLGVSEPCRNGLMDGCLVQVPARTVRTQLTARVIPDGTTPLTLR